jgi:hypothetical protein
MGILDDAIREHLDLKRKHGARDSELREIEDEALGAGDRPDPFVAGSELIGEISSGETPAGEGAAPRPAPRPAGTATPPSGLGEAAPGGEEPTRLVEPGGIEPPSREPSAEEPQGMDIGPSDEPISPPEGLRELPGQERFEEQIPGQERLPEPPSQEAPPATPSESLEELIEQEEPFPEDSIAPERAVPEAPAPEEPAAEAAFPEAPGPEAGPPEPSAPETAERPGPALPPESGAPLEPPRPEVEEPEESLEPESGVPEPPPPPPPGAEPAGRARGRVDVPTQEHPPPGETGGIPPMPAAEPEPIEEADEVSGAEESREAEEPGAGGPQLYDFETDEEPVEPGGGPPPMAEPEDEFEALGPAEEEAPYVEGEEPHAEEPGTVVRPADTDEEEAYQAPPLERGETYEEESEGDDLWFEKGPPQDFDFEDDER